MKKSIYSLYGVLLLLCLHSGYSFSQCISRYLIHYDAELGLIHHQLGTVDSCLIPFISGFELEIDAESDASTTPLVEFEIAPGPFDSVWVDLPGQPYTLLYPMNQNVQFTFPAFGIYTLLFGARMDSTFFCLSDSSKSLSITRWDSTLQSLHIKQLQGNEQFAYSKADMVIDLITPSAYDPPVQGNYPTGSKDLEPGLGYAKAHIRFYDKHLQYTLPLSNGHRPYLCKPVIFVEGLDLDDREFCEPSTGEIVRFGSFGWDVFTQGYSRSESFDHMKLMAHQVQEFLENGHDIILIDFKDGADWIGKNALLLEQLIDSINLMKQGCEAPQGNIVIGASMGGQISRIALANMERENRCHDTKTYVSFDSPHKGASIPLSLQAAAWFSMVGIKNHETGKTDSLLFNRLHRPAAMQLLIQTLESALAKGDISIKNWGNGPPLNLDTTKHSVIRNQYASALDSIGYPQSTFNIAIADGSEIDVNQGYPKGTRYFRGFLKSTNWAFKTGVFQLLLSASDGEDVQSKFKSKCKLLAIEHHESPSPNNNTFFSGFAPEDFNEIDIAGQAIPCKINAVDFQATGSILNLDHISGGYRSGDMNALDKVLARNFRLQKRKSSELECEFPTINREAIKNSFIPTMSALDINWPITNVNLLRNIEDEFIIENKLCPFSAYYAPNGERDGGANLGHVEITNDMRLWIDSILAAPIVKPLSHIPTLPNAEPHYNFAGINHIIESMDIVANGWVSINENGGAGFGLEQNAEKDIFEVRTYCDAHIHVRQGGKLSIGAASENKYGILYLRSGSSLRIHDGGELLIKGKFSKLVVEPGASLILDQGARIKLWDGVAFDGEAMIDVQGHLAWNGDIVFEGNGYFYFKSSHTLGVSQNFRLHGYGKSARFIQLQTGTELKVGQHPIDFQYGKVVYEPSSKISNEGFIQASEVVFRGKGNSQLGYHVNTGTTAFEVRMAEQIVISACDFTLLEKAVDAIGITFSQMMFNSNQVFKCKDGIIAERVRRVSVDGCTFNPFYYQYYLQTNSYVKLDASWEADARAIDIQLARDVDIKNSSVFEFDGYYCQYVPGCSNNFSRLNRSAIFLNRVKVVNVNNSQINNNYMGIECPLINVATSEAGTNLIIAYSTFSSNYYGIRSEGGKIFPIASWGLVDVWCSDFIENQFGIYGRDLLLEIDNKIPLKFGQSSAFINKPAGKLFYITYISRNPGTIRARRNLWTNGVAPLPDHYYLLNSGGLVPLDYSEFYSARANCNIGGGGPEGAADAGNDCVTSGEGSGAGFAIYPPFETAYTQLMAQQYDLAFQSFGEIAALPQSSLGGLREYCTDLVEYSLIFGEGTPGEPYNRKDQNKSSDSNAYLQPNIFSQELQLVATAAYYSISIYNVLGQAVFKKEMEAGEIFDCSHLPIGTYVASIENLQTNALMTRVLVKIKS